MKKGKKLIILSVITVIMIAVVLLLRKKPEETVVETVQMIPLFSFQVGGEMNVTRTMNGETITIDMNDSGMFLRENNGERLNSGVSDKILDAIMEIEAESVIENPADLSEYGLDNPQMVIKITTNGNTFVINIGNFGTMGYKIYASIGDGKVYLIPPDIYYAFLTPQDMMTESANEAVSVNGVISANEAVSGNDVVSDNEANVTDN